MAEYTIANEPIVPDIEALESKPPVLAGLQEMLARPDALPQLDRGPVFAFEDTLPAYDGPAQLLDDPSTVSTVPDLAWLRDAGPDAHPIAIVRNEAGEVVSICHSARSTGRDREAGIETAVAYRGRNYAVETTRLWATTVTASGGTPVYSTQWSNTASRAVAKKLGLVLVGEDVSLR